MGAVLIALGVALIVGILFFALIAYRLTELRREGTPVLLRLVPAAADEGWRHGTIAYSDEVLRFYRLSSLRPGPTVTLIRTAIEIQRRRGPEGTEDEILAGMRIVELEPGADGIGGAFELAMSAEAMTAFTSWLESRQSARSQRRR
ncbi:hypothetical protein GOEFS_017_00030 [Gordonia effusa NBRC 100432]|uniref:DUF2550 domain-containing protein n=1 Tax=Gordonia effusa NBRC 100432 TaxID=1077974 RepID=H0QVN5_9ACTN|nr:DUF2550 domain-containing protein [Gordonia effusa]GAB16886.1 hypothetical protein GOEFS_017_00030 [Gordonia effusa NBRC 100432]